MSKMTLADMAREIERRRPGTLPSSCGPELTIYTDDCGNTMMLPDDLAHAILRDAMVMAMRVARNPSDNGWHCFSTNGTFHTLDVTLDSDHGNCPTRSLFAAFCAVFPEPTP